ncbi:MAG: glyoxylate/hydroxypyruvate reductase A [Paraglaciecola sp.]|nr:glyoxylate/hydroxypyruvate reductase A [Paraglaciecola sp.]NCT49346.1 glyoxylate/hydroxypyruvate reductase A [Paraglaciecola sp.]
MSLNILYRGPAARGQHWQKLFAQNLPEVNWHTWPDVKDKSAIDVLVCWIPPRNYQQDYPNLKVIFSVGAGVDQLGLASVPEHVSVVRMLDPALEQQMTEYVLMSVLNIHRDTLAYAQSNLQQQWQPLKSRSAAKRRVGIMGLGNLGQAAAQALVSVGFTVSAWSKSVKTVKGIQCFAGSRGLQPFLQQADILVCLLPLTDDTRGILNLSNMAMLPSGASIINVGRGEHLVEADLLILLKEQHLRYAILDVFDKEPLTNDHPFWQHPQILVTPHIAAITQNDTAGQVLVENVKRYINQQAMLGLVDKQQQY